METHKKWAPPRQIRFKCPPPGYQDIFHFDGYVGPLECIFIAPLALFNEGAPGHFFHLMEAPMMRLQSAKILLRWPSRMHIYGFVYNRKFLEQFDSMGVPGHIPILWLTVALFNEGAPGHFFHLMEVSTMRLPNVKMLLRWSSRMQIS